MCALSWSESVNEGEQAIRRAGGGRGRRVGRHLKCIVKMCIISFKQLGE
jgi:hypothetical protein